MSFDIALSTEHCQINLILHDRAETIHTTYWLGPPSNSKQIDTFILLPALQLPVLQDS